MKKMIVLAALICPMVFGSDDEVVNSIIKLGYQSSSDSQGAASWDIKGFTFTFEAHGDQDSFLTSYAMISKLDLDGCIGSNCAQDDIDMVGFGLKFNLRPGDVKTYTEGLREGMMYAKLGWERADFPDGTSESGKVLGIGYEKLFDKTGLFIEFKRHDEDTLDDDSLTLGAFFKF